jgi:hypothetical protein
MAYDYDHRTAKRDELLERRNRYRLEIGTAILSLQNAKKEPVNSKRHFEIALRSMGMALGQMEPEGQGPASEACFYAADKMNALRPATDFVKGASDPRSDVSALISGAAEALERAERSLVELHQGILSRRGQLSKYDFRSIKDGVGRAIYREGLDPVLGKYQGLLRALEQLSRGR